nr:hypothetical protein [Saprospiraceae bacterium]
MKFTSKLIILTLLLLVFILLPVFVEGAAVWLISAVFFTAAMIWIVVAILKKGNRLPDNKNDQYPLP